MASADGPHGAPHEDGTRRRLATGVGTVEVWLPRGIELTADPTAPAGESYVYWSPDPPVGTFSVARLPSPGRDVDDPLALDRELGGAVAVERDETSARDGRPARRLRYRVERTRPAEMVESAGDGGLRHVPEHRVAELVDFLIWTSGTETLRVGYRIEEDAPAALRATFAQMLDRARVQAAPR